MELPGKRELREHHMSAIKMYIVRLIRQSYVQVMADTGHFLRKKN